MDNDLTQELAELNSNAKELLEKYDGSFSRLEDSSKTIEEEIKKVAKDAILSIQEKVDENTYNQIFDSGWFDVRGGDRVKGVTISHNLNSSDLIINGFIKRDETSHIFSAFDTSASGYSIGFEQIDKNSIYVYTGNSGVFGTDNSKEIGADYSKNKIVNGKARLIVQKFEGK